MSLSVDLSGLSAVVTGATRGIGRAVAGLLARAGADVAILGRDAALLAKAAQEIGREGARVVSRSVDVSDAAAVRDTFKSIVEELGRLDILVNNAGITRDNIILRMREDEWQDVLATNLTGVFNCMQAGARHLLKAKAGSIVNMTSVSAMHGNVGQANYAAAKAGIIALTKSAAKEFATRGVRVNAVAPGLIDTDMTSAMSSEVKTMLLGNLPLARLGSVDEVASAVLFLASPLSSYVTGHVLVVDGGLAM